MNNTPQQQEGPWQLRNKYYYYHNRSTLFETQLLEYIRSWGDDTLIRSTGYSTVAIQRLMMHRNVVDTKSKNTKHAQN